MIKPWAYEKRKRDVRELLQVEAKLSMFYDQAGGGLLDWVDFDALKRMVGRRTSLLLERE